MYIYKSLRTKRHTVECVKEGEFTLKKERILEVRDVVNLANAAPFYMNRLPNEEVLEVVLNGKGKVIGIVRVGIGSDDCCVASVRTIVRNALLLCGSSIVLVHNHPSGDPTPSNDDIALTKHVKEGMECMSMKLADHVIIGDDYYSFGEKGTL